MTIVGGLRLGKSRGKTVDSIDTDAKPPRPTGQFNSPRPGDGDGGRRLENSTDKASVGSDVGDGKRRTPSSDAKQVVEQKGEPGASTTKGELGEDNLIYRSASGTPVSMTPWTWPDESRSSALLVMYTF